MDTDGKSALFLCVTRLFSCFRRFANAFSYYGLVLLTTELFQEGGACGSESEKTLVSLSVIEIRQRGQSKITSLLVYHL